MTLNLLRPKGPHTVATSNGIRKWVGRITPLCTTFMVVIAALCCSAPKLHATLAYEYLDVLNFEVANQLYIATNSVPTDKKLVLTLKNTARQLDNSVAPSIGNDLRTLTIVSTSLSHSSLSNTFSSFLWLAAYQYFEVIENWHDDLQSRVDVAYPSRTARAAGHDLV